MFGCTKRSWRNSRPTAASCRQTSRRKLQTRQHEEIHMSGMLINLIIQLVAGAIGGNVAGGASKDLSLGTAGNTIAGAIGGGVGGQILTALLPILPQSARGLDIGARVGQFGGGGVAGASLAAIVGLIKNRAAA